MKHIRTHLPRVFECVMTYINYRRGEHDATHLIGEKKMTNAVKATEAPKVKIPADSYDYETLLATTKTKSAMIRLLAAEGFTRSMIAKFMSIRYQHVRNVLVQDAIKAKAKA